MLIFQFPGQGSQSVGMGVALADAFPAAKHVFAEIDDALDQKLSALMADGPIETLTLTENAQPALMAVSLAVVAVLRIEFGVEVDKAAYVAGHSLGEYSALTAAGAFSIADAARLLRLRGQAMQRAVAPGLGAMASLIGPKVDLALAEAAAAAGAKVGVCVVANDNNAGNIVISGTKEGVDAAIAAAKELGARAIPLSVSAPFHCPLMAPAAAEMAAALAATTIHAPRVPVLSNVTVTPTQDPDTIARLLVEQVTGRVRWRESIGWFAAQGATHFVELGAGSVLTGMSKRIAPDAVSLALTGADDIAAFAASLA
ncbi:malonyl CoA-acyl carrier protein transacylase [Candidatus Phycosocius bacilliformis]|uniref:Malonyl CoA-acyl carrier protein transacylase n=1 Tax=Candidatus Phycosocius bacilliformis TaxID=1445552 RepID=A0A2P2E8D2_9PROT|nr:ACP S-malonyltransferase [Candidatus Phycosocius bacilliformis]GBF57322.1 malonyl CoA-acyl carrier protein transacylase [Candidatus Phycosocius bacilliformis]